MNLFIWVAIFTSTFKGFSADSGAAPPTSKPTKEPIIQDKKLPLPSTKNLLWHGACSNRLDAQRYAVGGIMFPKNATASLGNFRGTCVSDPEACLDGLSFELWVWFAENDKQTLSNTKSIILQSGSMKSRGIELSVINKTITFTVYAKSYISESQVEVESFKNWIHLVGVWIKKSHSVQLFAGGVKCSCTQIRRRVTNITDDLDGNLTLGPIAKVRPGFVVLHNLSIWMRAIRDSERQTRLKHRMPTQERQEELDEICNKQCSAYGKSLPWLARFSSSYQNYEMQCLEVEQLSNDTQCHSFTTSLKPLKELKDVLFRRPLYGNNEIQMWLDHMCNDPLVNNIQNLQPSLINYIARFDNNILKCERVSFQRTASEQPKADEVKLKSLIQASCAQIPLGPGSGEIPYLWFTTQHLFTLSRNESHSWCSDKPDNYIEIDLVFLHQICALNISSQVHRWTLWYSSDKKTWSTYFQLLKVGDGKGQILPVYIMARYLRLKPHDQTASYCVTNISVNGSSQAYRAASCQYYWEELSATEDGLYITYPNKGSNRSLVLCLGSENHEVVQSIPIHDHDMKLQWPSTKNLLWHGACSDCLDAQRYAIGGIMFPKNATASLGNFRGTCVSDPEACLDGLSFELWVWFAENDKQNLSNTKSIILQSGSMKSRGIELSVINKTITFTVYAKSYVSKSELEVETFKNWIHLVGVWIKRSHSVQLFAGGANRSCMQIRRRVTNVTDDLDGNLTLGPIAKVRPGFVVLHNLSIWMRAIRDSERQTRLKHPGPKMPLWANWTNCPSDCKQKRYRNCPGCEVEIVKTRICHDTYICGLKRKWPLNNVSNLSCPNCRNLVASSALILPINSTIILGNFKATCLAEPRRCIDGLTFEIYLWFAEYKSDVQKEQRGTILKSGFTLGFRFIAGSKTVYFQLFNEACVRECDVRSNDWVHIVGIWFKSSNSLNLFMDKVNNYCNKKCFENAAILKHGSKSDDNASAGDLTLGPIQTDSDGYVIAQNLSIWMRAIKETELDELFTHNIPALPENWEQWSKCVQPNCTTKRRRKCQSDNCTVNIVERKNCGVCKAPPSTCKTPDGKEWNSTKLRLTIQKYCKNLSFSQDWLVILERNDTTSNFTRTWKDYRNGFDNLDGNHFVGNERLHQLTRYENFQIMVYFHDPSKSVSKLGTTTCDSFNVSSEEENYAAEFKRCKGPAAHALSYLNGASFSTPDRDNDLNGTEHCAQNDRSGFWYKDCGKVSFTISGENIFVVSYLTENGSRVEMHAIIMMIKPYHKRYHELNLKLRFINESWNNELADNSTHRFFLLAGKIKQNIGEIYRNDSAYTSATIVSFRQGSVIATIILDYLTINGSQIASLLMDLRNGYLNAEMAVSYKYSDLKISGQSDDRPEISDLYNTSSTSFNISWRKLTEMTGIRGYKIYYTTIETAAAHWSESDVTSNQSETTITNLKMFTVYFVCVLAYSNNMTTLPSQIRNVTTDESVPEVAPNDITVYWNKTDSTVLVTWAHIPRPLIRGYLLHYVITYSNSTSNFTQTSPTNSSVITRLALFTHYQITVAAATRIGVGPSRNISYRTRGIPLLAPTNLTAAETTGGGITVSWISIPDDVRYDEVIGYRVYYYDQAELRNITRSVHQTNLTINDVKVNVNYDFTVCGLSAGEREGRRAYTSIIIWNVTVPKMPPKNLTCPGSSPYTISVGWYEYTADQTGGSLKNYILWYHAKGNPSEEKNITLRPYPPWYTLENLRNSTEYKITVFVYNEKGFSPSANITCKTKEGRPTTRLQLLHVNSSVGENIIPLTWQQSQGKVRGYKVLYQKVSEAGSKVKDASNMKVKRFSADKTSGYVGGLTSFSKYCFKILVFNEYFDGPSSNFKCAETCRCPRIIFTNWFVVDPYVISSNSGIFPALVKRMISDACGYCETYNNGTTIVHFQKDGNRKRAQKRTSKQVQQEKISNETQISFPVVGPKTGSTGNAGCFMPIIKSPSSVFITRKPVMSTVSQLVIGKALVGTLPLLAFTFVMLLLGAILIWAVEHPNNYDTIPKPFFQGVKQSLWWAFVSVTTVGYGDKVPKSIPGRIFAMIWILYGIALISLVTTGLTTALTATIVVVTKDVKLYGSQVAAVDNSLEFQLGLLKGARMNQKKNFSNVISVLEAVENGDVDGGLVDRLTAARLDKLHEPNSVLVIKDIIEKQSTYGVFVSGKATKLCQKFQQYLRNNANFVTEKVKQFSEPLKKGQVSSSGSQGNWTASGTPSEELIISASSPVFLPLLLWLLGVLFFVIMVALAWHFLYFKHVFAAAKKNKVIPLNNLKEDISSLQQFLTEFRDEAQRKVREIKVRHVRELKTIYKLKTG